MTDKWFRFVQQIYPADISPILEGTGTVCACENPQIIGQPYATKFIYETYIGIFGISYMSYFEILTFTIVTLIPSEVDLLKPSYARPEQRLVIGPTKSPTNRVSSKQVTKAPGRVISM